VGQTNRSLNIRYRELIGYIRNNNPQSAYAQHILRNQHEYGTMNNLMTLLKPLNIPNMLTPYEQFYIPEQCPDDPNPLFELAIHPIHAPRDRVSRTIFLIPEV